MLFVHVSYGHKESGQWEELASIPLTPYENLLPAETIQDECSPFGLDQEPLELPNGEAISISVSFLPANNSLSFIIEKDGLTHLNLGTFKPYKETWDPSIIFRTPNGLNLSFMFCEQNKE
ncbi:hypothetical protein KR52_03745 [Synechococcus sp. KORDI-52]|uniref:hypothetical protein n=1 Tax=Synechococcus sp. KORDI-52 TaxID=585425 RepID=UPI0004E087F7|nr:hypothetical protein [Synechococcus sp. KORDI-52]AII48269.1 hypothetical protein KR52_03745 [Synechococcus sp. KORDI-52]